MTIGCQYSYQPTGPLDSSLCPSTILNANKCAIIDGYEYRCTLTILDTTQNLEILSSFDILNILSTPSMSFCDQATILLPSSFISPQFCGQIQFQPHLDGCWNNSLNTRAEDSSCNYLSSPDTTTEWQPISYTSGCLTRCYDEPTNQLLGVCTGQPETDLQGATCGATGDDVCSIATQKVYATCEMLIPRTSRIIPALSPSLCTKYALDESNKFSLFQKCFKLTSDGSVAITPQTILSSIEAISANSLCTFQTTCKFEYTLSSTFSLDGMTSDGGFPVNQWSTENCLNNFSCANFKTFCGISQRISQCQFFQNNDSTNGVDIKTILLALNHPDYTTDTDPNFACSTILYPECTTDNSGCYEPYCWAPMDIDSLPLIASTDFADYDKNLCLAAGQQTHCNNVTNQYCGKKPLPIFQRCVDRRTNDFADSDLCDDVTTGLDFQCYHYQNCLFSNSVCQWIGISETNETISIPGEVSFELCTRWLENPETICNTGDFCGDAITHSKCYLKDSDGEFLTVEDPAVCELAALSASQTFPNFQSEPLKQLCNNRRLCSAWACSPPRDSATLISEDIIASKLTDYDAATTYFDVSKGTLSQTSCFLALDNPSVATVCGLGEIVRNVGCLTKLTPPYVQTSRFEYDPDASECGTTSNPPPARSQAIYSTSSCVSTLECSLSQSGYSESFCSALSCPALPEPPGNTNGATFWFQHQSLCTSQNGTIIFSEQCNSNSDDWFSALFKTATLQQCQYISDYCTSNFRVPLGFGPEANVTLSTGKYDPLRSKAADPLSLSFMVDSACSKKVEISDVSIFAVGSNIPQRTNMTVTSGAKTGFSISYSTINVPNRTQTLTVYLVPVIQDHEISDENNFFQLPYPVATFSSNGRQNIPIPSYIPPGEYIFVLFLNALAFKSIPNVIITVIPSLQPTSYASLATLPITAVDDPCTSYKCYNGKCIAGQCQCATGFSPSTQCKTPTICTLPLPTPSNGSNQFVIPKCNLLHGFIGPELSQTIGTLKTVPELACSTCHCLGNYSPTDGCTECALQCGIGIPDDTCTVCTCPVGYSGTQCECQHRQFMLNYRSLPPLIARMFNRSSGQTRVLRYGTRVDPINYEPQSALEIAQLIAWKRILIVEVSADLNISSDLLQVVHWGSRGSLFTVIIDIKFCAGYPTVFPSAPSDDVSPFISTTTSMSYDVNDLESPQKKQGQPKPSQVDQTTVLSINTQLALLHHEGLNKTWANFTSNIASLSKYANNTAPLIGLNNLHDILVDYYPSFNYSTLIRRFSTRPASINSLKNFATTITEDDQFMLGYEDITHNLDNSILTAFQILAGNGVNADGTDIFQYKQTNSAIGLASDISGGFLGFGDVLYSQSTCSAISAIPCTTFPNLPTLAASAPSTPQSSKPFNSVILIAILVPLLFIIIFGLAIFLCCSWKYQKFCFEGYREKKKKDRRTQREQRKNKIDALKNGSTTDGNSTELTGTTAKNPSTLTTTGTATRNHAARPSNKGASASSVALPASLDTSQPPVKSIQMTPMVIDDEDEDDDDDYEYGDAFDQGTEVVVLQSADKPTNRRGSLHIGGLRRISTVGLPPGWTMLILEGKPIYINETTMQSTSVKPNSDGTIPNTEPGGAMGW